MKATTLFFLFQMLVCTKLLTAQPIPIDSLYLGENPPGETPVIFPLPVDSGSFAAERIAITNDGKEIYYTSIHNYYPTTGDTIRYFKYADDHWTGPFNLLPDYLAPGLSPGGDSLFFQDNSTLSKSYFALRTATGWSEPRRIFGGFSFAHYLQEPTAGKFYISTVPETGQGGADWCTVDLLPSDTSAVCIGLPVSSSTDNLDFFVARDESYMILAKSGLKISYRREDGGWTNPKSLGGQINFGLGAWGPWVTPDNRYLFYTTGTLPDYSDTYVYWARIDQLTDSLRHTNFIPYLKNGIPRQNAFLGRPFEYAVPDTVFIDDDGNNTLTYSARLTNGNPLPGWLAFDTLAAVFSGIPDQLQELTIRIIAKDPSGAIVYTTFKIGIGDTTSVPDLKNHGLLLFPNPTNGLLHVKSVVPLDRPLLASVCTLEGRVIREAEIAGEGVIDLSDVPSGIYLLRTVVQEYPVIRRICVF